MYKIHHQPLGPGQIYLEALLANFNGVLEFTTGTEHIFFELMNQMPSICGQDDQKVALCHLITDTVFPLAARLNSQGVSLRFCLSLAPLHSPTHVKALTTYLAFDLNRALMSSQFMSPHQDKTSKSQIIIKCGLSVVCEPLSYHYHQLHNDRSLIPPYEAPFFPSYESRNGDNWMNLDVSAFLFDQPCTDLDSRYMFLDTAHTTMHKFSSNITVPLHVPFADSIYIVKTTTKEVRSMQVLSESKVKRRESEKNLHGSTKVTHSMIDSVASSIHTLTLKQMLAPNALSTDPERQTYTPIARNNHAKVMTASLLQRQLPKASAFSAATGHPSSVGSLPSMASFIKVDNLENKIAAILHKALLLLVGERRQSSLRSVVSSQSVNNTYSLLGTLRSLGELLIDAIPSDLCGAKALDIDQPMMRDNEAVATSSNLYATLNPNKSYAPRYLVSQTSSKISASGTKRKALARQPKNSIDELSLKEQPKLSETYLRSKEPGRKRRLALVNNEMPPTEFHPSSKNIGQMRTFKPVQESRKRQDTSQDHIVSDRNKPFSYRAIPDQKQKSSPLNSKDHSSVCSQYQENPSSSPSQDAPNRPLIHDHKIDACQNTLQEPSQSQGEHQIASYVLFEDARFD